MRVCRKDTLIVNSEATDAWGKVVASSYGVADRYGYTQRERDDESSLMHYRARSYDPRLGRFIQTDPALEYRINRHYSYAENDPLGNRDPHGNFARKVHSEMTIDGNPRKADSSGALVAEIVRANIGVDCPDPYRSAEHFDNSDFFAGAEAIEDRYKAIADAAQTATPAKAREIFGKILHAIQDFYSHSNYVDAYVLSVNPGIQGMENMNFSGSIPLWDRKSAGTHKEERHYNVWVSKTRMEGRSVVVTVHDYNAFGRPLISGTYPEETDERWSHKDLNKDFDDTAALSPEDRATKWLGIQETQRGNVRLKTGQTLHKIARDVAQRQTTEEFERFFRELKKNDKLKDVDVLKEE